MLTRGLAALAIALALTAGWWRQSVHGAPSASPARPQYLVVIVMDGFRPDYMTLAPMKHLKALMAQGTSYDTAWVGHIESTTPASHATIATGVYPRKHQIVGFGWRETSSGRFTYAPTNLTQIGQGYLRSTIAAGGVPTLADQAHAADKKTVVVAVSGEKYYAAATMGAGADYGVYGWETKGKFRPLVIGSNVPPPSTHFRNITVPAAYFDYQDGFAADLAVRFVSTIHPRVMLVNMPAADEAGHFYGGMIDPRDMTSIVKGDDNAIRKIVDEYKKLGIYDKTLFVVTADHGMVSNRHIVPIHQMYKTFHSIAGSGAELHQEYRESLGAIWLTDPQKAAMVAEGMEAKHFPGVEGVFYKTGTGLDSSFHAAPATAKTLPKNVLRAYIDLANTEATSSGADILLAYREDTMGFTAKDRKTWGKHGGFSWGSQHIPLVIAGPGIKRGISHFPAELVDIAPTIERAMGWQVPPGVDGVVLSDALAARTGAEAAAQSAVEGRRSADLHAVRTHSLAQH